MLIVVFTSIFLHNYYDDFDLQFEQNSAIIVIVVDALHQSVGIKRLLQSAPVLGQDPSSRHHEDTSLVNLECGRDAFLKDL
jgi:hypothetical protein